MVRDKANAFKSDQSFMLQNVQLHPTILTNVNIFLITITAATVLIKKNMLLNILCPVQGKYSHQI